MNIITSKLKAYSVSLGYDEKGNCFELEFLYGTQPVDKFIFPADSTDFFRDDDNFAYMNIEDDNVEVTYCLDGSVHTMNFGKGFLDSIMTQARIS